MSIAASFHEANPCSNLLSPLLGCFMLPARLLTGGTSSGVPWKAFKHRGEPFTDSDERRSALACAAQDERPFEAGDDHFSERPPDGLVGPGEFPRDRGDPSIHGVPADCAQRFVSGVEIQRHRTDRTALVRARTIESGRRSSK